MHRHNVILKSRLAGVARMPAQTPGMGVNVSSIETPIPVPPAPVATAPPALDPGVLRNVLADLADLAQKIKTHEQRTLGDVAQMTVELAAALAERLVGAAIVADRQRLDRIVVSALEKMPSARAVVVRGHPADLELLERLLAEQADLAPQRELLTLRQDEGCGRGQMKLEADDWFIEWDTQRSLAELRAALIDETFTDE
jgi:flagellar biosynthesis/type III secretory pathway protein FliH